MLRLNPSTLSQALGQQLLEGGAHLRPIFEQNLLPVITTRLLDPKLQRSNSGSITVGSALSLFLASNRRAPKLVAEIGTYIGNSAAAIICGCDITKQAAQLITCDINPCTDTPLDGLNCQTEQSSGNSWIQHPNVRIYIKKGNGHDSSRWENEENDLDLLGKLTKEDTLIALDDYEGDEKGHINLDLFRRSGLMEKHVYVEPFKRELFPLGTRTRSATGFLLPKSTIVYTRQ